MPFEPAFHAGAWFWAGGVFLLAGVVKGIVGLGLPTVSMALLALWMPPAEAAALLVVPSLLTNLWQLRPWRTLRPMLRRLGGLQVGVVAGGMAGAWLFGAPAGAWGEAALGLALLVYAGWGLAGRTPAVASRCERWLGPLAGVATGLVTALTGVFVVPAVPYLQALRLQRDELIQAMGLSFTTSTLVLFAGLVGSGDYAVPALGASLMMLVPALVGMALGGRLRRRLPVPVFRRCFLVGVALLGAYMAARPFTG